MSQFRYSLCRCGEENFIFKIGYPMIYDAETDLPLETLIYHRCAEVNGMPHLIKQTVSIPSNIWSFVFLNEGYRSVRRHPSSLNKWKLFSQTLQCIKDCFELAVYHTHLRTCHLYLTAGGDARLMGWDGNVCMDDKCVKAIGVASPDDPPELQAASEVARGDAEAVIAWRYGCVAYELCVGEAFEAKLPRRMCNYFAESENPERWVMEDDVRTSVNEVHDRIARDVKNLNLYEQILIRRCMHLCPKQRATIKEIESILYKSFIITPRRLCLQRRRLSCGAFSFVPNN